jgi:hypothetical protein
VFAASFVNMETLKNFNKSMIAVATKSCSSSIIILSTIYDTDDLKRLNTIGRHLTQGETNMMVSNTVWNMDERDVGDNSF